MTALLKGKLSREQENMEDILTSNVFGLLQYLRAEDGLLPFLARAEDHAGDTPLASLASATIPSGRAVEYNFWPPVQEADCFFCEPDVLLTIPTEGARDRLILIEAKYLSGKSSEANDAEDKPTDQLAKEWDNLVHRAKEADADPILIYLTADIAYPAADIDASIKEFTEKRHPTGPPTILWLTWRRITDVFGPSSDLMLQDLVHLVKRLNLVMFEGFLSGVPEV